MGARLGEDARPNYLRHTGHPLSRNERPLRPKSEKNKSSKNTQCVYRERSRSGGENTQNVYRVEKNYNEKHCTVAKHTTNCTILNKAKHNARRTKPFLFFKLTHTHTYKNCMCTRRTHFRKNYTHTNKETLFIS